MGRTILLASCACLVLSSTVSAQQANMGGLVLPSSQTAMSPLAANTASPVAPVAGGMGQPAPQAVAPQVGQPSGLQPVGAPQMAQGGFAAPAPAAAQPAPVDPSIAIQQERDDAFNQALREAFPMSPGQIRDYRGAMQDVNRAAVEPVSPGRPVSRSLRLTLKPGEATPVLRLQQGIVSTLTFSDATGQPWPVRSVTSGNPAAYVAQSAGEPGQSNIVVVSALQAWVPSNLVVTLAGYPVPITMALQQGEPETDFRIDVQMTARGPFASAAAPGAVPLAATDDHTMMTFLDGVPPSQAKRMRTNSSDVEVWAYDDMMYVRTPGTILSPAYVARAANVSGVNVFSLAETPVLIVSRDGRTSQVMINR